MMIHRGVQLLGAPPQFGDPLVNRGVQLMGPSEIENLQRALNNLGVAVQQPAITCKVTGTLDNQTMTAISASIGHLTKELPSWLFLGLQGAMAFGAASDTAKKYIGQYATQLTVAVNTAAVRFKTTPPPFVPASVQAGFFAPGWHKTPLGLALIVGGLITAFFAYRGLTSAPPRRA